MSKSENPSEEQIRAAALERDRARNVERGHALIDYVLETSEEDPAAGLQASLIGSPDTPKLTAKGEPAPFWSVKARQLDLLSFLLGRMIAELEKGDLYPLWTTGGPDFDRDVARALWQLGGANIAPEVLAKIPAQAMAMAKVIHRYVDIARKAQNKEGGYHPSYPGVLVSGGHDALKLRRAGKAAWAAFVRPLLDDRTFDLVEPDRLLDLAWEAFSLHQDPDADLYLCFKDAGGWIEYNARFGFGSLREAVVVALERAARRTGIYAVFGTEPRSTLEGVIHALEKATGKALQHRAPQRLQRLLASLGPVYPLGVLGARFEDEFGRLDREALIDLGVALLPEREDMPAFGEAVPFQGKTLFEAIDAELLSFISGHGVDPDEDKLDFASGVVKFGDGFNEALADRLVAFDNPPGRMAELLRQFLKLNVTHWWTDIARRAALKSLVGFLGQALLDEFQELDPAFAVTLSQYGIDAETWETVRADMGYGGNRPSEAAATAARERVDGWAWERLALVVLDADRTAGTSRVAADYGPEGKLLRFLAQFRQLRAPFAPKARGTLELREADRAMVSAMTSGDGLPALANLFIWTVLLARLSKFAFNLTQAIDLPPGAFAFNAEDGSKIPREPKEWPWFDSAMVGGCFGLCADMLFGDVTGLKALPLSAFATIDHAAVESALEIWRKARSGEDVREDLAEWAEEEGGTGALDTLQVTRQALNYALLHQLQDMMSPGYLQRTMKDMKQRTRDAYWRWPSLDDSSDKGGSMS